MRFYDWWLDQVVCIKFMPPSPREYVQHHILVRETHLPIQENP